ncbi:HpcH/HpaI aldolase/citrate lyase family protein [Xanthovirga aplysinae]|uniref:HpcH/HpaI aldolase/citrate lyase family protein n=1 Tax=Xanthovirga aplysinae TaxID=2529853 RepID=UPI0012BB4DF1|nr:CoA ester lyase [Xanthovirga aplysinae]MTI32155.1 CoA ester lyase [Xanthovirga aplysinae]
MNHILTSPAILFTPGNKAKHFQKAEEVGANGIILDLEDGVSQEEKNKARDNVIKYLIGLKKRALLTIIRINQITTEAGLKDVLALRNSEIHYDVLLYPKVESSEELFILNSVMQLEQRHISLVALVETGRGLSQLAGIVSACPFLKGIIFGAADYAVNVGCDISWDTLLLSRQQIVQAAAIAQIAAIDCPCFDFENDDILKNELLNIKAMGFTGKLAIHPKQIPIIKQGFRPSEEELKEAEVISKTYEKAGGKACQYQGKMIDLPIYKKSQHIIARAKNTK